jgi:hypothetical protein
MTKTPAVDPSIPKNTKKTKRNDWGPIQAARQSKRNLGKGDMMERAKQYKMRQNLEIPKTFKGNSFAVLSSQTLAATSNSIDVVIGDNIDENAKIISELVNIEHERAFKFAKQNPEIVLPDDLDINHVAKNLSTNAVDDRLPDRFLEWYSCCLQAEFFHHHTHSKKT